MGIIPRAAQDLFGRDHGDADVVVKLSYLQIYCEQIQDLLKPETGDNLSIREFREGPSVGAGSAGGNGTRNTHTVRVGVPELQEIVVTCLDDCLRLIQLGNRNRSVAFTDLNATSSRSHAVVIFTVTTTRRNARESGEDIATTKTGRLYMVDLAGSERLKKSKSVAQRAVEARAINLSLTTLGKCVNARATGQLHVPFRDSKLTRLLQESLGGNAKTSMIVAVRSDADHAEETFQSLEFGSRAMHVQTHAHVNIVDEDEVSGGSNGSNGSNNGCKKGTGRASTTAFEKLQRDAERNSQMLKDLKKDQERSKQVIDSLEREKQAMVRAARELRNAHKSEKDAFRTRALQAEQRAIDAEVKASRSDAKVAELREQLDRAMGQLDASELHLQQLVELQAEHTQLLRDHASLQETLAASRRDTDKYKRRAKEAAFKLDILLEHNATTAAKTDAAIAIQRAFRAYRARKRRAKVQELARTKEALAQLATRHAAGERVLGESLEVLQEAVEGILETFVFNHTDRKKGLKETETTRERDLIPAVLPALADDSSS